MISENILESLRETIKWQTLAMVEQDLVISRALVCLYNDPHIKDALVFRGGTALNKLFIKPPARYSEDIDFVQKRPEPIGVTINAIRDVLKPWLGNPKWRITERGAKLIYQYQSVSNKPAKLKVEINTTEHLQLLPFKYETFSIESQWFSGSCEIVTYELIELMATKLRALYQRRKGRDLFDVWHIFSPGFIKIEDVLDLFYKYCAYEGIVISRDLFQKNLELKKEHKDFCVDMSMLLPRNTNWNFDEAYEYVQNKIICRIN